MSMGLAACVTSECSILFVSDSRYDLSHAAYAAGRRTRDPIHFKDD
jgi:hypothetical protein